MYESRLLLDESPLTIQRSLAKAIGLNEAIVIQQLHYWLLDVVKKRKEDHFKEGYYWVWNTLEEWHRQFDWWSLSTVRRVLENLEDRGLVITGSFNRLPLDKTKWYRIDYEMLRDLTGETRSLQHPELQASDRFAQNEQTDKSMVSASNTPQTQGNPLAQNEHMDCSERANRSAQNEHMDCSNWTNASAQNEQSNNQRIHNQRIPTENTNPERDGASAPSPSHSGKTSKPKERPQEVRGEQKRKSRRLLADDVYPLMSDEMREMFEKAWAWYCDKCNKSKSKAGDKVQAAHAWLETITPENIDQFRLGCKLFFKDNPSVGIPHFYGFIAGNEDKPTPYWISAINQAESAKQASGDFLSDDESEQRSQLFYPSRAGEWNEGFLKKVASHLAKTFGKPSDRIQAIGYISSNRNPSSKKHDELMALCFDYESGLLEQQQRQEERQRFEVERQREIESTPQRTPEQIQRSQLIGKLRGKACIPSQRQAAIQEAIAAGIDPARILPKEATAS